MNLKAQLEKMTIEKNDIIIVKIDPKQMTNKIRNEVNRFLSLRREAGLNMIPVVFLPNNWSIEKLSIDKLKEILNVAESTARDTE